MKNIVNILLAILVITVVISLIIEPLTDANFFAGGALMCIASASFLLFNRQIK